MIDFITAKEYYLKGLSYEYGTNGVILDYQKAILYYKKAIEFGSSDALNALGNMYSQGKGLIQSDLHASKYYLESAKKNNANGQYLIAWCFENGKGVSYDLEQALYWYKKSYLSGHKESHIGYKRCKEKLKSISCVTVSNCTLKDELNSFHINRDLLTDRSNLSFFGKIKLDVKNFSSKIIKPNNYNNLIIRGRELCDKAESFLMKRKTSDNLEKCLDNLKKAISFFDRSNDTILINFCKKDIENIDRFYHFCLEEEGDQLFNEAKKKQEAEDYKEAEELFLQAIGFFSKIPNDIKIKLSKNKANECHKQWVQKEAEKHFKLGEYNYQNSNFFDAEIEFREAYKLYSEIGLTIEANKSNEFAKKSYKQRELCFAREYFSNGLESERENYYYNAKADYTKAYNCFYHANDDIGLKQCNEKIEYCKMMIDRYYDLGIKNYNLALHQIESNNIQKAIDFFKEAKSYFYCINEYSIYDKCNIYIDKYTAYIEAEENYKHAVKLYNNGLKSYHTFFITTHDPEYFELALDYFEKAEKKYSDFEFKEESNKCYDDISDCYDQLGYIQFDIAYGYFKNSSTSISYYNKAIEYFKKSHNSKMIEDAMYNIKLIEDDD